MLGMAKLAGYVSRSKEELRACNMVFYFLVGNVFFLSLLSGSLLEEIGESVAHPKSIPSHLARAVSAQVRFGFLLQSPALSLLILLVSEEQGLTYSCYFAVIPSREISLLHIS